MWLNHSRDVQRLGLYQRRNELAPGDTLLLFTDGITEAMSKDGREFGEEGLIEVVRAECHLSVERLLDRILERVSTFSSSEQEDDITLVAAR